MKTKLILFFLVVAMIAGGALFVLYSRMKTENEQAQQVMSQAQRGQTLLQRIESERTRCEQLISSNSGKFGEYEYCKGFVEWGNKVLVK